MSILRYVRNISVFTLLAANAAHGAGQSAREDYIHAPMPPGIQVISTELEGPIFADAQGRTLYRWPRAALRNGNAGDEQGKSACDDTVQQTNAGLMSPYPGGFELPEVETRPSCMNAWPPLLAATNAVPVGNWTIIDRTNGRKQWAYKGWAVYTSFLDKKPGDVLGATNVFPGYALGVFPRDALGNGAIRYPIGPDPNIPPQFTITSIMVGRLVTLREGWSIYTYEGDNRNKSNCAGACLDGWSPVLAASYAASVGEWTTFERSPGVRQWAFRGMPVYRSQTDSNYFSRDTADTPQWHNVYTQMAPAPPRGFVLKETIAGLVLGDFQGRTIYHYKCNDDALDQLACDYPDAPQAYRFAVCGGGDPSRCVKVFPYVIAPGGAKSGNAIWGTMYINPNTGKAATSDTPAALNVWTFRGRPIYTFAGYNGYGDMEPGDLKANTWGEDHGDRNGFRAMMYLEPFGRH